MRLIDADALGARILLALPSAQPEQDDDLVSRSYLLAEYDRRHKGASGGARKIIEEAPSAQPERKKGKWIDGMYTSGTEYRRCINCFAEIEEVFFGFEYAVNYCPHCGAKMEV